MPPKAIKRKGMTDEEKQQKTLEYLHEVVEPTTIKDLIRILPKAKGVPFNNVEAAVKALIADDLVQQDKVGVNTLVWAFPATAQLKKEHALQRRQAELASLQQKVLEAESLRSDLLSQRSDPQRNHNLALYARLQEEHTRLATEAQKTEEDANAFDMTASSARHAMCCANVHTENISSLLDYMGQYSGMSRYQVAKECDIPLSCLDPL